ncbi:VWA domain-containing protein [Candidatus Sumerlaeota bacterium]|nr:VWA domain-containing protein [Candidatus Sumerlaeota bacterium]
MRRILTGVLIAAAMLMGASVQARIILLPRAPEFGPLRLDESKMRVEIKEQAAQIAVDLKFYNPHPRDLECEFMFPLPPGAQVTDFEMMMNGKKMAGEVLEKDKARQIYTDIVRRMRDPGLIEMMDHELFKASIYPVPARGHAEITLHISQLLKRDNSIVGFRWPLDAPKNGAKDLDLSLDIRSSTPIRAVYSPTHELDTERKSDTHWTASVSEKSSGEERSYFECFYTLSKDDVGVSLLTHRPYDDQPGSFMLLISPSEELAGEELQPVDFTFVLDRSGSMRGEKIKQAKEALKQCVAGMRDVDRFNIVAFSTEAEAFHEDFVEPTDNWRKRADDWIDKLRPSGGTNIDEALALAIKHEADKGRLHMVLFITDGLPTIGVTNADQILKGLKERNTSNLRVFVCGVGYDVNARLCDEIANATRAASAFITNDDDLEARIGGLFQKISAPVLTGLELQFNKGGVSELYPKPLPDLFSGDQLTVFGRYSDAGSAAITLTGKTGSKDRKFVYEETFKQQEDENEFVETLWGSRKIGYLLENIRANGESDELREEVIALAKKYGVVTPYTSYLVTEDSEPVFMDRRIAEARPNAPGQSGDEIVIRHALGRSAGADAPTQSMGGFDGAADHAWSMRQEAEAPLSAGEGFAYRERDASGEAAVNYSMALSDLKASEKIKGNKSERLIVKTASSRTFHLSGGFWIDEKVLELRKGEGDKAEEIKIHALSDAYFELLKLRPELKEALALGERVAFELNGRIVIISDEGEDELTSALRKKLAM